MLYGQRCEVFRCKRRGELKPFLLGGDERVTEGERDLKFLGKISFSSACRENNGVILDSIKTVDALGRAR